MPEDPYMLLSFVNTQLRDSYSSFEDLCKSFGTEPAEIEGRLAAIDYHYSAEHRQFICVCF